MGTHKTRKLATALLVSLAVLVGCNAHQSEDAAREEVKAQEEIRKVQEVQDAAANEELRRSEKGK
jgi:hypothetical protein